MNGKGSKGSNYERNFMPCVLICLGCYNKIPKTWWHFSQFWRLRSPSQGIGRFMSGKTCFLIHRHLSFLLEPYMVEEARHLPGVSVRLQISFVGIPLWPNLVAKAPPPNSITLGLGFNIWMAGWGEGHKYFICSCKLGKPAKANKNEVCVLKRFVVTD